MRKIKNLGKMCRDLRETLQMTQADVASDLNITVSAVSRFESGNRQSIYILSWYVDHGLNIKLAMSENRCVCCGNLIPDGRALCSECEGKMNNEYYPEIYRRYIDTDVLTASNLTEEQKENLKKVLNKTFGIKEKETKDNDRK